MNAAVLVVENDRDLRELDRRYLEWAGHAGPRTTGPAEEALHLWKSGGGKAGRNWRAVRRRAGAVAGLASTRQRPWAAARQKVNYHLKALEAHGLVSSIENSLARGLHDAAAVARGTRPEPVTPTRIGSAERLNAMALLQQARPDLSHTKLMAVVDAAAWWLTDDEHDLAMDLLDAVTPDAGSAAYFTLRGRDKPGSAPPADAGPS